MKTWPRNGERRAFRRFLRTALLTTVVFSPSSRQVLADDTRPPLPHDMYGGIGMIEMPSARIAPDGELSMGASYFHQNQRYSLGFQILPWLETSFRYAGLQHLNPSYSLYYDRSFELKARLLTEGEWAPAIALGINDLVGTGVYSGEYIVASKQFGSVDTSIGLGWGRLGTFNAIRNPLSLVSKSFNTRPTGFTGTGGDFNLSEYFRGPAGIFGGINWRTPVTGLTLIAELSSDSYVQETQSGNFKENSHFNFGASYQVSSGVTLGMSWLYGSSIAGNVSFQLDPTTEMYDSKIGVPPIPEPVVRTAEQQRSAIEAMLYGPRASKPIAALVSKNQMVDSLWRQKDIENIDIKGHTLILTVPAGTPAVRCLETAAVLQSFESDLVTVVLQPADGGTTTRCAAPAAPDSAFRNGIFIGTDDYESPRVRSTTLTIDARPTRVDAKAIARTIIAAARKQLITVQVAQITNSDVVVYYINDKYFHESDALNRLTALLMREAPPNIERFRLIAVQDGIPLREFDVLRAPQERKFALEQTLDVARDVDGTTVVPAPMYNPIYASAMRGKYPQFGWSFYPEVREQYFDPDNPLGIQFLTALQGSLAFAGGVGITATLESSVYDTFRVDRGANSGLPHVRTDYTKYFAEGKNGVAQLEGDYQFRLAPNVLAIARAGYLESMFGGVGGEILWRPEDQRWALGVDAYQVWQRNFNRLFGFQHYQIFTGHISAYYESPWYGLDFAVHAGQYLAGDRGMTVEVTRRFRTGVEIGAFFTKTNVSAQQFGEGSFDKGIIIRIPLGWELPFETQGEFGLDLRPIQRDGGQRLEGDTVLYAATQRMSSSEMSR